ncbi:LamG domain-containing protein [Paracoccus yeei]|uniref:LamG domain-containing protein n=1 Tax=Paracoccus yeei TaxID=147645 RepID=A0A5P2QSM8_9RHOB|nr:LamG domain-containing protein [Paracoccus yeei]QEU09058.1 LamG domain-containing protein [Paracoccus yeei]
MTLLINPNAVITNPVFPPISEMEPDLALRFRAANLSGFAEGADVTAFLASGQGPERLRLFDRTESNWLWPTYNTGAGRPSLRFGGGHHITDFASVGSYPTVAQPATVFATFRTDGFGYGSATYARILGGGTTTANSWVIRPTNVAGQFYVSVGSTNVLISSDLAAGAWGVIGVVYNGASSRIISPSGVISAASLDTIPLNGIRMGGNSNPGVTGTQGFIGDISEARVYTRAMTDAELLATWQAMGGAG